MSKYAQDGYIYFPPIIVGGPTGDYEAKCPVDSCEEAEFEICAVATEDTGTPKILISGDGIQPSVQLKYDGSVSLGARSGSDQGVMAFPGIALCQSGSNVWNVPVGEFFPITDSQRKIFLRIDVANSNSAYVTLRYRVRPIRKVVGNVTTVHEDHEQQHNIAREQNVMKRLNAETIKGRGEGINL